MVSLKSRILDSFVGDAIMSRGTVASVSQHGSFYLVSIRAPEAVGRAKAGDKVQLHIPDVGARTYTPFACLPTDGTFNVLAYARGDSPGSRWARGVRISQEVRFVGPSRSLQLDAISGPVALLGDETSLAIAHTVLATRPGASKVMLEVHSIADTSAAARAIGIGDGVLTDAGRTQSKTLELAEQLATAAAGGSVLLTGHAQRIQVVRRALVTVGARCAIHAKAYWSSGKSGLD